MDPVAFLARNLFWPFQTAYEQSSIRKHLDDFEKSQWYPAEKLADLRMQRLNRLLQHAYDNCPFYRKRFDEAGLTPAAIQSFHDLRLLPVLTKSDIQNSLADLKAAQLPGDIIEPDKTGGSTGSPLNFFVNRERNFSRNGAALRHDRWTGWNVGEKSAYLWGHREDLTSWQGFKAQLRNTLLERRLYLDTSDITVEKLDSFTEQLLSFRPKILVAYANSVYLYARFLKETGRDNYYRPSAIITSAELLAPEQRQLLQEVFECRVFDRYGSRETGLIGSECPEHSGLHICAEALHVEIIKDDQPATEGESGKIVVTDLLNYGMPFIRYRIEDVGLLTGENCRCGRSLPLMKIAGGRMTDFLVTPEGKIISGASLTIYLIANTPGIAKAQFIQEEKDEVTLRIVPGEAYSDKSLKTLERLIPDFFGSKMNVKIEPVDEIPLSSSGKHRFSISKLDPSDWF